ncbi:MAG TPA: peptide chain release factor 1 [Thermodesulfobacteriota bacterium]|nr:peptide chain release factor 1 [Deltaproteobacteria bacterium]HNR14411.1 peptide chain release factor 1 [Thermodesulfobacteriota bacterium]HNU70921.1 peptide chain release factor 1 [Thermodesulfobacteriota bacterium]
MFQKLESLETHYESLAKRLSDPEVLGDKEEYRKVSQEYAELSRLVDTFRSYKHLTEELEKNKQLLLDDDPEIHDLAQEEIASLKERLQDIEQELKMMMMPQDPLDKKNIIVEIRAGTGGEEAALFAADLFRMYTRYAEIKGWRTEILSHHPTGLGGIKEIIALIEGNQVYSQLKYESGVHRVQRVPSTESQGRIHTSAVTVAVLPEAEEVDVTIDPNDLRIDYFRSSGPGGQHVNKTDSAVRLTHLPTGMVVSCQDEKSQHKNKAKAMKVLRARLLDLAIEEQHAEISQTRKSQVGSGDRSERIRTYNFPQGRITDHRIGLTVYRLEDVLEGNLEQLIEPLRTYFQNEALRAEAVGT